MHSKIPTFYEFIYGYYDDKINKRDDIINDLLSEDNEESENIIENEED